MGPMGYFLQGQSPRWVKEDQENCYTFRTDRHADRPTDGPGDVQASKKEYHVRSLYW